MFCCSSTNKFAVRFLTLGFAIITAYRQNDYKVVHHYAKVVYFNRTYLSEARIVNVKPNRTHRVFNFYHCQLIDMAGNSLKMNVHGYTARPVLKDTPVQFDTKICDVLERNIFGVQEIFKYSNLTKCPMKKGCYTVNNFVLPEAHFPPFIPPNEYVFKYKVFYENVLIGALDWRGEIVKTLVS